MTRWRENLGLLWSSFHRLGSGVKEGGQHESTSVPYLTLCHCPRGSEAWAGRGGHSEGALSSPFTRFRVTVPLPLMAKKPKRGLESIHSWESRGTFEQNFKQKDTVPSEISRLSQPVGEIFGEMSHLYVNSH